MRSENTETPDLLDVVLRGLTRLLARQLRYRPAPEDLPMVAEIMTEDLVRAGKTKHLRVAEALEQIGTTDRDWPQPARVIEVISEMTRQRDTYVALPRPPKNDKLAQANIRKIREMLATVVNNGQPKPKAMNAEKHLASANGTLPLTDEEWIEAQRIFQEANQQYPDKPGEALRAQNAFIENALKAKMREITDAA